MQMALDRRGVPADEVDLINPHGTSTPLGDKREAEAIWTVFGDRAARDRHSLLVSGTKSMTGHMMGAAGAFEAFATVMSVAEQRARRRSTTATTTPRRTSGCAPSAAPLPIRYALSNNIGLGGHNARDHLQALGRPLIDGSRRGRPRVAGHLGTIRPSVAGSPPPVRPHTRKGSRARR